MRSAEIAEPSSSPLFTLWTDPKSGVKSWILDQRVAPQQQSFYFCNPSFSADGRYYWFYCSFPPAGDSNLGRSLAVIDFKTGRMRHFPETMFLDGSPFVDPRTGEVYWCIGLEIWKRTPNPEEPPVLVNKFPAELANNRPPWRLATHLMMSADRKSLNLDAQFTGEWFIGEAPLDGSPVSIWQRFERCYNHSLFNPADPELQLVAQSEWFDASGEFFYYENHIWLIRRGGAAYPVFPDPIPPAPGVSLVKTNAHGELTEKPNVAPDVRGMHCHHFWGADGKHLWYVDFHTGIERVRLGTSKPELMWPHETVSHAHAAESEDYLVLDALPPDQPEVRLVSFVNLKTKRSVDIVSFMPELPKMARRFHIHPHPQFCLRDRYICYTTTVRDKVDVAFARVDELIQATS
jgi:hypothetical protein